MTATTSTAIAVGTQLSPLTLLPVKRIQLALFAGASGDHHPIHIDIDFARKAGMPDVFAHGMLGMAWLGRLLTNWMPQAQLRKWNVRFVGITQLDHVITCSGVVKEIVELDGESTAVVQIQTINQYGEVRIAGEAMVALPATQN